MGYQQWLAILKASSQEYQLDKEQENTSACPNDGEPLRAGPDGRLYCPYDGWRPGEATDPSSAYM